MHILITGGTGFIGSALCHALNPDNQLTILSRQAPASVKELCGDVRVIHTLEEISPSESIDAIINLAGEPIADKRWTKARKSEIRQSRLQITKALSELVATLENKPRVFISGSAVGYYGAQGSAIVDEDTEPHNEFSHRLCKDWEKTALEAEQHTRVCLIRTGLVLGKDGGFLERMRLPFRLGLGAKLGSGEQYMPWIHLEDMVGIICFLLNHDSLTGPFNASAPEPATNREFSDTLAATFNKRAFFTAPAFVLKLALGEMSRLLLTGQRAIPRKLLDAGYAFRFTSLKAALRDVLT